MAESSVREALRIFREFLGVKKQVGSFSGTHLFFLGRGSKFRLQMYVWVIFECFFVVVIFRLFVWMSEEGRQLMDDLVDDGGTSLEAAYCPPQQVAFRTPQKCGINQD